MDHSPHPPRAPFLTVISLLLAAATVSTGCASKPAAEQRYDLKGKVLSVDRARGEASVAHEEVKGFMAAMTMDFPVRDPEALKIMEAGDTVQAALVVADDGAHWLEGVVVSRSLGGAVDPQAAAAAGASEPQPGAEVPDVKLVNQDGRPVGTRQYGGRALVVTFIYTRCPIPNYCPLMSTNFAQLHAALAADPALRGRTQLLSVTLDPEYDRPAVLRSYGATYAGGKFEGWDFATGDPAEVRRLAEFFGLTYKAEGDQVIHSLRTAVVAPDGRLFKVYRGNEWKPDEVLGDLKKLPPPS